MYYYLILLISFTILIIDNSLQSSLNFPKYAVLIISIGTGLILFSAFIIRKNKNTIKITLLDIILWLRLCWIGISNPNIVMHPSNLGFIILLSLALATFLTRQMINYNNNNNSSPIIHMIRTIWMIGLFEALYGLYQFYLYGLNPFFTYKTPMIGTLGSVNGFGLFMAMTIIALSYEIGQHPKRKNRFLLGAGLLIVIAAFIMNKCRGAMLALAITGFLMLFIILFYHKHFPFINDLFTKYRTKFKLLGNAIRLVTVILCIGFIGIVFLGLFLFNLNFESSFGRIMIWKISIPMFTENPIFGIGHGQYGFKFLDYQAQFFSNPENQHLTYKAGHLYQAHNEYLEAFCTTGLLGGFLFLLIWIVVIHGFLNYLKMDGTRKFQYGAVFAILLVIMIHSLFDSPLHGISITTIVYVILGILPIYHSFQFQLKSKIVQYILIALCCGYTYFCGHKLFYQYIGQRHWKAGLDHVDDNRLDLAAGKLKKAYEYLPENSALEFMLGGTLVYHGEEIEGISYLEKALTGIKDINLYVNLIRGFLKIGDYEKAEHYTSIYNSMFPNHITPYLFWGMIYYYQGKIELSRANLEKCIHEDTLIKSHATQKVVNEAKQFWRSVYSEN